MLFQPFSSLNDNSSSASSGAIDSEPIRARGIMVKYVFVI